MGFTERTLSVAALRLDLKNPRFPNEVTSQPEAIRAVLAGKKQVRELCSLARSIATEGLDPSTLPVVTTENGHYVVLEGNRRITALKLLSRPALAPDADTRRRFERIAADGAFPTRVKAVVYDTREEYDDFLEARHTGENGGVGLKPWKSAEKARFRQRRNGTMAIHTALLAWCQEQYAGDDEMASLVAEVKSQSLTTLKRFLMVPIRPALGLTHDQYGLTVDYTAVQLRPFLRQLFSDLLHGRTSQGQPWSRANLEEVELYVFETHRDLLPHKSEIDPAHQTRVPHGSPTDTVDAQNDNGGNAATRGASSADPTEEETPPRPRDDDNDSAAVASRSGPEERTDQDAQDRQESDNGLSILGPPPAIPAPDGTESNHLFPGVAFDQFGDKVNALGQQAQKIAISKNAETCGVLCRVVIDLACTYFLARHQQAAPDKFLWKRIVNALQILDPNVHDAKQYASRQLHEVWSQTDRGTHGLAVPHMNDFVHGILNRQAPSEVRRLNVLYTPFLIAMETNLRQAPNSVATGKKN